MWVCVGHSSAVLRSAGPPPMLFVNYVGRLSVATACWNRGPLSFAPLRTLLIISRIPTPYPRATAGRLVERLD